MSLHKAEVGEGESGSLSLESSSLAGDTEVLAGKTAGPETSSMPLPIWSGIDSSSSFSPSRCTEFGLNECHDVTEVGDSGPSLGEDRAGVRVDLTEADCSPASSFESQIESADS